MDDIGPAPTEHSAVEIWIGQNLKKSTPESVANALVKNWDESLLTVNSKRVVAKFLLLAGLKNHLLRMLKLDLRSQSPLPWEFLLPLLPKEISKDLKDALLIGIKKDDQLYEFSATALLLGLKDSEWQNFFNADFQTKNKAIKEEREKLFKDLQIFRAERMDAEVAQALTRILTLFPDDVEALTINEQLGEKELEQRIDKLKQKYTPQAFESWADELPKWPELEEAIGKIQSTLDLEQTYLLSIALFQMGFFKKALEVLRESQKNWKIREKLWEAELLLHKTEYAEALNAAQIILSENQNDDVIVKTALYYSAKAFYGLGDREQALSILKGISQYEPHFRDVSILLVEWS